MPRAKFICFCTPTLGTVSIDWCAALRHMMMPLNYGYTNVFMVDSAGGEIAETRNKIVRTALSFATDHMEVTHLFWLDDDVIASRAALVALFNHDRDIVSGVYFLKGEPSQPLLFPSKLGGAGPFVPDRLQEVWGHGMGLTLVKADVYRRMAAELPLGTDKYGSPAWYRTTGVGGVEVNGDFAAFDYGGTEDLYFLDRAARLGYRPAVDTGIHAFGWHYDAKAKLGYPLRQWRQWRGGRPIVWDTPEGPVTWCRDAPAEATRKDGE